MAQKIYSTYSVSISKDDKEISSFLYVVYSSDFFSSTNLTKALSGYIALGCSINIKIL